ncbi:adenylyl-sulfate kinase [Pseudodesulfovibrio sp. zrk46]|uniref:adenylyl-sulfate kinase n=1 Tax=Pseudodesulfovibrio sp. zrk46 TaxID=2725288 RepID=UPI0014498D98|nr:adenylyl-sulfate kinase [Pseudodesulfovibrio sp. zrk46]QJB55729.1 adenylyl-sulfate kinase [Pseudodesulfovibrio sp. zrk46]
MEPKVIWITGLSGAGKTTMARQLAVQLEGKGLSPVLLDGDAVREAIGDENCGHDRHCRLVNAYRICRLAKMIADQGRIVIVATMSLFHEIHEWNRANYPSYYEVLLECDADVLKQRDSKGHYGRGENLPGIDIVPELPLKADIVLCNMDFSVPPEQLANDVIMGIEGKLS